MSVVIEGLKTFVSTEGGWLGKLDDAVLQFGDRASSLPMLKQTHPNIAFALLNQIHSDRIQVLTQVPHVSVDTFSPADWPEGDAYITALRNVAICVRTADCVPVLISSGNLIAAVHAGWKGLESDILQKTVLKMRSMGADPKNLKAVIGPHIGKASFEVGRDVSDKLNAVFRKLRYNPAPIVHAHPDPEKRFVEMSTLAHAQLVQAGVGERAIGLLKTDTMTDLQFHSYRRDRADSGRQISLIYLK